ncbi:unnamed protein product [Cercopithifilaria johnstoni]|uniref:Uncharacterized protein n=1 Tax=Cercopithifilaria johnstoni TaxID=2874296 RepID=A0A8J2LYA3_9BILA|nr:unnamed protein product [Cercopithifilaria johnstoni]
MHMLLIHLVCATILFIPYVIYNCNKKISKAKQVEETSKKQQIKQVKKQITEQESTATEGVNETQEVKETIDSKKVKSSDKRKEDSKKVNSSDNPKCKIEKTEKVIEQEKSLPEIKEGSMKIADDKDPRYKTLYFFMDKNIDVFGRDKCQPEQPEIDTAKKISDDEIAAKIAEIKARYGLMMKEDEETEMDWNALLQAKNIEKEGDVLIFILPTEVASKVKKKKKRKKK